MKRKIIVLTFIILHFTFYIQLQAEDTWLHEYNPYPNVDGYLREDVVKCPDGGYAFCGTGFIWDSENPGFYDYCFGITFKVDSNGILEWIEQDTVSYIPMSKDYGLAVLSDGGIVTAVGPEFAGSCALLKRDIQGNRIWQINPCFAPHSLIDTDDGGFVAVGYAPWDENNMKKYNSNGELEWEKRIRASELYSVVRSFDGGYITSGRYYGQNNGDVAVAKTDTYGDTLWTRYLDGFSEDDKSRCVIENTNEEIIVVGDFDWGPAFFWKLNQEGETLDIEIVDLELAWAFWSVNEFENNTYITWGSGPDYNWILNRYDFDFNYIDTMDPISIGRGDKGFIVDDSYLVYCQWPNLTVTKTQYEPVSVNEDIIYKKLISLSNFPNPFNPTTTIKFCLPINTINPSIEIFNLKGQKVDQLIIGDYELRINEIVWNAEKYGSGVYFVTLNSDGKILAFEKITMIK